ncbi:hypothetical protein FACS1894214_0810 [Planctomycetales bacterium]|nr:hypothetical protein FACS1894214_0810 [Planctomycetales bacterium]
MNGGAIVNDNAVKTGSERKYFWISFNKFLNGASEYCFEKLGGFAVKAFAKSGFADGDMLFLKGGLEIVQCGQVLEAAD